MPTPNVDGLDLSHWNVVVDEDAIPHYPLMSCKATEGRTAVSPKFAYFWDLFRRNDTRYRGAYHWVRSDSTMQQQVDHLARTIDRQGGLRVGDFVQLDWETTAGIPNMTVAQIEEWVDLARARWGDRVIVYGSDWVPNFLAWRKANPTIPVWYANYNTGSAATGGWAESAKYKATVWQWTSTFKAPGFLWNPTNPDDGVDANHVLDWAMLDRLCLLEPNPEPVPEPTPIPEPEPIPVEEDMRAILYTVKAPDGATGWFYVSPEGIVRTLEAVAEEKHWLEAGALAKDAPVDEFRLQLRTFQPLGTLNDPTEALLGPAAVADWKARASGSGGGSVPVPSHGTWATTS